jgi:hypothetical protein
LCSQTPHAHPCFEGGAFIIAFSLVGHYLDGLAKIKARNNLSSLYKMQIKFASLLVEGKEVKTLMAFPCLKLVARKFIFNRKKPIDRLITEMRAMKAEVIVLAKNLAHEVAQLPKCYLVI